MSFFSLFVLFIINLALVSSQNGTNKNDVLIDVTCSTVPGLFIENRTRELECCETVQRDLSYYWSNQGAYLTRTLATLKAWNCPQFNESCSNRSLGFTDYSSLVYDRFCNESRLIEKCQSVVTQALIAQNVALDQLRNNWTALARNLEPSRISNKELESPCIQIALYDSKNVSWMNYHEIIVFTVPFCNSAWCGFDYETIKNKSITPWKCLPTRCKANVIILTILFIALAIAVVIANFTVILVYSSEKKMRHSQGIFRLSLGAADILVGLIALPTATNTLLKTYQHTFQLQSPINVTGQERFLSTNATYSYTNSTMIVNMLETTTRAANGLFPLPYRNSIGFFTTVSLTVSVYLLTVSGIDRLRAIARPLKYRQYVARRFAITSSIICWVLALLISILPTFTPGLRYTITSSSFITLSGIISLILYSIGFFLPLLATWIITGVIYVQAKKKFDKRSNLTSTKQKQVNQQRKLNFILAMMVLGFSLSILPTILVLILVSVIPSTNPINLQTYNPVFNNIASSMEAVAVVCLISNSLWNSIIYSIRTKTFRKRASEKYKLIWSAINVYKIFDKSKSDHEDKSLKSSKTTTTTGVSLHKGVSCSTLLLSSKNNSPIPLKKFVAHETNSHQSNKSINHDSETSVL